MNNKKLLRNLSVMSILALTGCGSNGSTTSTQTVTGQFVDTFVSGLNYTCSSGTTGVTNSIGQYTCTVGNSVEFFLGKYKIGSATATTGFITPESMYPNNPTAELNVARLLQTLDDTVGGVIVIPTNYSGLDNVSDRPTSASFIASMVATVGPLVSRVDARNHLDQTELEIGIKGKTKYYKNSKGNIGSRTYANDGTYTGTFEGNPVGGTYAISGNSLSIQRTSGGNVSIALTYLNTVDGVLNFDISVNGGATFQTSSYSTEAARDAI